MGFFRDFFRALKGYSQAISFISDNRLWGYFFVPAIINVFIFVGIGIVAYNYSGSLIDFLSEQFGFEDLDETLGFVLQFFMTLLIRFIALVIYFKAYKFLILILLSPVLALMAEKIYKLSGGSLPKFNTMTFLRNVLRGMKVATINMFTEIGIMLLIIIATLIVPIISPVSPFLIFGVESYFYGFSMMDYRHELLKMSYQESRKTIGSRKGLAIGNGVVFNVMLLIPILGVLTAPLIALTAAHLAINEK